MGFAYLLSNTGEGDQVEKLGASAIELFHVETSTISQHPFSFLQARVIRDPYGRTSVPIGRQHPTLENLFVDGYVIQEHKSDTSFNVLVVYKTKDTSEEGSFTGWKVSSRISTTTEKIGRALATIAPDGTVLPGELIGPHVYQPTFEGPPSGPGDPVGKPATHTAIDPATGRTINLYGLGFNIQGGPIFWSSNAPRRVEGFERIITTTDYSISKIAPRFTFASSRAIDAFGGTVNRIAWKGFPARTLLFIGFSQEERVTANGFEYPISVELSYRREGWTPVEFVETYRTESNEEAEVVRLDGSLEATTYKVYEDSDFEALFAAIAAGNSPSDPSLSRQIGAVKK